MAGVPITGLQAAALIAYLLSWVAFAIAAVLGMYVRGQQRRAASGTIGMPVIAGTLLQWAAFAAIMLTLPTGPLRPSPLESTAGLVLAPLAVAVFVWAQQFSAPPGTIDALVTGGAYRWLRHPIYLAFLMMLLATAFVASTGPKMLAAIGLFLVGSEVRIATEEAELLARYPEEFPKYRQRTKWRYLPGLR